MSLELKDLVGEHQLDAVDYGDGAACHLGNGQEYSQVLRFRLDGQVYVVTEDPEDGYRSSMLSISRGNWKMRNVFPACRCIGRYRSGSETWGPAEILELIDSGTGKLILEVGTDNNEDYYPSFVAAFHPEALAINSGYIPS